MDLMDRVDRVDWVDWVDWNNDRAIVYRQKYGIPSEWGTAVNV
ncbi:hypothetical protein F1983_03970, partial [Akkermansia sp. BIOML-A42]